MVVSRWEFMPGGVFFVFASAALACLSWQELRHNLPLVWQGGVVWYLSHLVGSQVNCLADCEIDKRDKARLSAAVERVGPRALVLLIAAESAAAIALACNLAADTGRRVLPLLWLTGLAVAIAYSVEPLRLKRRGWLNPTALLLVLYALPMAFGYVTLARTADRDAIGALAATGLQMLALLLLNPAEDLDSDRAQGIETPVVRHGLPAIALLAVAVYAAGAIVAGWFFAQLADGGPVVAQAALGLVGVVQLYVLTDLARLALAARRGDRARERRLVRHNPLHFALLGTALAVAGGLVLA